MKTGNFFTKLTAKAILVFLPITLMGCDFFGSGAEAMYDLGFSVRNETTSTLSVRLVAGEIPSINAGFEELVPIPRNENHTSNTVTPGNNVLLFYFGTVGIFYHLGKAIRQEQDMIISFVFTISRGNEIIYRVVGWDVPESDMEKHQIDEKMWGLFDTSEQDPLGDDFIFWRLRSGLFPDELQSDIISERWTYFVRVTPSGAAFEEMTSRRRVWR